MKKKNELPVYAIDDTWLRSCIGFIWSVPDIRSVRGDGPAYELLPAAREESIRSQPAPPVRGRG